MKQESKGSGESGQITEDEGYLLGLGLFLLLERVTCLEYKWFSFTYIRSE